MEADDDDNLGGGASIEALNSPVPMLPRTGSGYGKKSSKFEDSDSHMSRPRAVSELPHRPAPRVPPRLRTSAAEASGGAHHRVPGVGRGASPRGPLHEKKPAGSGAGAGARVAELEAKLGKAHDQLTEMREQVAAAGKARKDARGAFAEAKKRFAGKKGDAAVNTSAPVEHDDDNVTPAEQEQQTEVVALTADVVTSGGDEEARGRSSPSPATDVLEPIVSEPEKKQAQVEETKNTPEPDDGDEVNSTIAIVPGGDDKKGNPEADELRAKLAAKDKEVYELRAKVMVRDVEVDELRVKLTAKDADANELTAKLVAKDSEIAALRADNADLMKMAEEAYEAAKETAAKAAGTEHAVRESAAREARLAERLRASELAREALEAEMQLSRVQNEQWRKAAEEAAAVLGGASGHHHEVGAAAARGGGAKDRRRHSSAGSGGGGACDVRMDKLQDADGEGSGGKRKSGATGGAMRALADLWKKKVQK